MAVWCLQTIDLEGPDHRKFLLCRPPGPDMARGHGNICPVYAWIIDGLARCRAAGRNPGVERGVIAVHRPRRRGRGLRGGYGGGSELNRDVNT